jgi:hypothetical protein
MWSSTTSIEQVHNMHTRIATAFLVVLALNGLASSAEIHAPAHVTAGTSFSIESSGSGKATFYLIGPYSLMKRTVDAGGDISIDASEVEHAGRYLAVLCADQCSTQHFYVQPADGSRISLLVHPSRVPVGESNAISAVAFVFDKFHNLNLAPGPVDFKLVPKDGSELSQGRSAENGVAWISMTSGRKEGPVKIGASIGKTSEIRVVQQVAADACDLRIKPEWIERNFFVETDPVRDCSGNSVPDGTVVSFTKRDASGETTVDVPIKKGIARVEMPVAGEAHITVASGVVTGNELNVSGKQ